MIFFAPLGELCAFAVKELRFRMNACFQETNLFHAQADI